MISILEQEDISNSLITLQADSKAKFGMMTAQHMVEHLALFLRFSNGKDLQVSYFTKGEQEQIREAIIKKSFMPQGFKSPVLPKDSLLPLRCATFETAVEDLLFELKEFKKYFEENPIVSPVNPIMGELNFSEWVIFHNCHFTHHFNQFGII